MASNILGPTGVPAAILLNVHSVKPTPDDLVYICAWLNLNRDTTFLSR